MVAYADGKICYMEIPAINVAESAAFYETAFGWSLNRRDDGSITFSDTVSQVNGMWAPGRPASVTPGLLIYIMVFDAIETIAKIVANGGTIVQPIGADAPEITARFSDPAGNVLGIYQQKQ
jgi:uncharacterized protein